ncbi:MAG: hydroxypyruvate reductase [Bordetella sp. SCN 67-23]|nr:glycerate kinase [Burkholderiales bacterium]ODS71372.1 MAG: hydroxypyruvate reductase [Bordetella sp. SCN 67-23]OJW91262.1 MAG: glycerate kinase [Burkholderiales bacterium 67-32]
MPGHLSPDPRRLLEGLFDAAVRSALPRHRMAAHLPPAPRGRTVVVGAGKAAASMAEELERCWPGELSGVVVTRYGHGKPLRRVRVLEAAHPVPDAAGERAATTILETVGRLTQDDLVICLLSGGGSALLSLAAPGVDAAEKRAINLELLRSGAPIGDINCIRRHLSAIKGGRLAAACHPARVHTIVISDVAGDDPMDIASGPTVADPTTSRDALVLLDRYGIAISRSLRTRLAAGEMESIKPGDPVLARSSLAMMATPYGALQAAARAAGQAGVPAFVLGDRWEGEAKDVGRAMAGLALHVARGEGPFPLPCVLLTGGETTVTVRGQGRGGRNVQFLLSLMLSLQGAPNIHALAADTDGVDGIAPIAGALIDPTSLARSASLPRSARDYLEDDDGHGFFQGLGDSIVTGPTYTNVNDFRAVLILPAS